LKKYQSKISDSTNIYFITLPISLVTENKKPILNYRSNISSIVRMKMDEILNFSDNFKGYEQKYSYYFLLFIEDEENSNIKINWINDRTFIVDNINPNHSYLITKENSLLEKYEDDLNYAKHGHSVLQSISTAGDFIESNEALIKVEYLDQKLNKVSLTVELNEEFYNPKGNDLFFLYKNNNLHLVKGDSNK